LATNLCSSAPIKAGDSIVITAHNNGAVTVGNPAGILATITYLDETGTLQNLQTGASWTCNGKPALLLGANNASNIWTTVKGSNYSQIDGSATWIWDQAQAISTVCSITVPTLNNGVIRVTVDDVLDSVTVNGVSVTLPANSDNFTILKLSILLLKVEMLLFLMLIIMVQ
jgi:hypothetical protein